MGKKKFGGGGGGGMPDMNAMMKQAQQMQKKMAELQEELEDREFEATAGGGAVNVVVSGKKQVKAINIKPEVVDPDDVEMLEDLVIAAVNEALRTADETVDQEMGKLTGGMGMPPGF